MLFSRWNSPGIITGFITAYALAISTVSSHSVFMFPKPYSVQHCNLPECTAPCPRVWGAGINKAQNAPGNSVIWKRGQMVDVGWHKNNHYGGFVRHSFVPLRHMYEHKWHSKTAFEWGCFSQGYHECKIRVGPKWDKLRFMRACGTDARGTAFRTKLRVPQVFKDGNYVLATVWFGGISENQRLGKIMFPDYHMCAFVRIRGGKPLAAQYTAKFNPGKRSKYLPQRKCRAFATVEKRCDGWACADLKIIEAIPREFERGNSPPVLKRTDIEYDAPKKWVVEESRSDETRKGWSYQHSLCDAAYKGCLNTKNPIRHLMCASCHAHFCAISHCPWCSKYGIRCSKLKERNHVRSNWNVRMHACAAIHYACHDEKKPAWLRRNSCFICQSIKGCDGISCQGSAWCAANAARCRAVEF